MKALKSFNAVLLVTTVFILFFSCEKEEFGNEKTSLKFISEEYKPFNYSENSVPGGLATELLEEICSQLNTDCEIEFMPWEAGVQQTLSTDNAVLFSTVLNSTRKDKFKWAGPFASLNWNFYSSAENTFNISNLDEAKNIDKIGVIEGYAIEEFLVQEGFTNLVYCNDNIDGFNKLLTGEVDLFPSDKYTTEATLETMGNTFYSVNFELTIKTELLYFAFNKNVPDNVVSDFQDEIDATKKNGKLKELTQKYLHTSDFPDVLQIYTEPYPPLTFMNENGEITGYGTDVLKEIMKRNNNFYDIHLSSWSNGYQLALNNPNFCLYTMDRTEIRENLFQWVGPIGTNTTWFYTKNGSDIVIESIDDAKNLSSVGTISSWFSAQYLQEKGFTNLVYESNPEVMAEKLIAGQVDAFVCTDITFPNILEKLGYTYNEVKPSFSLMASDFYIAFSQNTSPDIVNQWQSTLDNIKEDGTYNSIHNKWFP